MVAADEAHAGRNGMTDSSRCPTNEVGILPRTIMVTGSRGWRDEKKVESVLGRVVEPDDTVIHGGAAGADRMAYDWCRQLGFNCQSYAPDVRRPSPQRYHERNDKMLDLADVVLAFWDGESTGTYSVIKKAVERRLPLEVIR